MTINLSEQIGIGDFAGETDELQESTARKFATLLEEHFAEYVAENYPDAELEQSYPVENVSGCTHSFGANVSIHTLDPAADNAAEMKIETDIQNEYKAFCADLERNETIYV